MNIRILFQKYKNISAPVKAGLWFAICNILQKGISMITVPIFTRILTTKQYGVFSVYQSWSQIIMVFATLNLYCGVFNNGMIKYEDDKDGFTSSAQGLTTITSAGLFIIYYIFKDFWNSLFELSTNMMVVMFVEIFFVAIFSLWSARQRYEFKYKDLIIITMIMSFVSPLIGIFAVLSTDFKAEARILSFALVNIAVGIFLCIRNYKAGRTFFKAEYWKYMLLFNLPLVPHYLSQIVLQQSDRIMISKIVGKDEAAIYSVVYNVSTIMLLVTTAINNTFIPYTYKTIKEKKYDKLKSNTNILVILVGMCVFFVMAFGPEIIKIFAPKEYYEAIWIIPPVATTVYFMFLYPLFGNVEFYYEKNKFVMVASTIGAVSNIIMNLFFIRIFGYIAAGYTTLVCYIMFSACHYLFMKKILRQKLPGIKLYDIKFIFIFSLIVLTVMCVMLCIYELTILRYLLIIAMTVVLIIKRKYFINALINIKNKD